jgi:ATP-binding cassette subfamily F protein 3
VHAAGLSKAFGGLTLFEGLSFRVRPGERLAVVGRNGSGKTTLLRILAGQVRPDAGAVSLERGARVALHDQRPPLGRDLTLGDYVAEGLASARDAERRLEALQARMAAGDAEPRTLAEYERALAALEQAGGYAWRSWLERVLRGLSIPDGSLQRPLETFSGGELTRASLARTLVSRPDVLLLDEPTNHLDVGALEWLERTLAELGAAVVLVSHDRWFLESAATAVLELDAGRGRLWAMRWSAYRRERALALGRQAALAERQAAEIARLERFVARWSAGTRSRQATARRRRLERMAPVTPPTRARSLAFGFPPSERSARVVIEADGLGVAAGGRTLVGDLGTAVERGWRVAVVGPNAAGKTSLVETLIGLRAPTCGRVALGHRVRPAYFSQHAAELREGRSVLETALEGNRLTSGQARNLLGAFLFPGDAVERPVERLSGGERRRLGLVRLIASGGNLLVLDEPTNHLDTESREALEAALQAYDGTILLVSHDRALVDAVATHTLALEDGRATLRPGGYSELVAARDAAAPPPPAPAPRARRVRPARAPNGAARARREAARLEARIDALERELAGVEADLADPAVLGDRDLLAGRGERHRVLQEEIAWLMVEWEAAAGAQGEAREASERA